MDQFSDHFRVAKNCARNMSIVSGSVSSGIHHCGKNTESRSGGAWGGELRRGGVETYISCILLFSLNVVPCTGTTYLKKQVAVEKG